jgi:hypothetical protein
VLVRGAAGAGARTPAGGTTPDWVVSGALDAAACVAPAASGGMVGDMARTCVAAGRPGTTSQALHAASE